MEAPSTTNYWFVFSMWMWVVPVAAHDKNGKRVRSQLEIDFVCNQGSIRYFVQSAYRLDSEEKQQQEQTTLKMRTTRSKRSLLARKASSIPTRKQLKQELIM